MILDLITYVIIVFAFLYAGYKILGVFKSEKKSKHKAIAPVHREVGGCDDCPAECTLRDYHSASTSKKVKLIKDF